MNSNYKSKLLRENSSFRNPIRLFYFSIFVLFTGFGLLCVFNPDLSEDSKSGNLQKVSHSKLPNYYKIQLAYLGGVSSANSDGSSSFSNTQEFKITKECFDTLQKYNGSNVVVEYVDKAVSFVEPGKYVTGIKILK